MDFCRLCDGFDQSQVQALSSEEEAFTDEVVARAVSSGPS